MTEVKIKRLHPSARLPFRGSDGAAAWDITATDVHINVLQTPGAARQPRAWWVSTGLSVEIPEGYCMKIYARSGLGTANFLRLANNVTIIDSDYRGEIKLRMIADEGGQYIEPMPGMVIAQAMIEKVEPVSWAEVDELSDTARGGNGFGSTSQPESLPQPDSEVPPEAPTAALLVETRSKPTSRKSTSK